MFTSLTSPDSTVRSWEVTAAPVGGWQPDSSSSATFAMYHVLYGSPAGSGHSSPALATQQHLVARQLVLKDDIRLGGLFKVETAMDSLPADCGLFFFLVLVPSATDPCPFF